jgi:hypothetical protein
MGGRPEPDLATTGGLTVELKAEGFGPLGSIQRMPDA